MLGNLLVYLVSWLMWILQFLFSGLDWVAVPSWITGIFVVFEHLVLLGSNLLPAGFLFAGGVVTAFIVAYRFQLLPVRWVLALFLHRNSS